MGADAELNRNIALVVGHFDDFVNRRDLDAIARNMTASFRDHDGPGGREVDRSKDRELMAKMHAMFPDLKVEVKDVVAQADRVVVRNPWTCTEPADGRLMEFHGFVLCRIEGGKIAERWATVTPMQEASAYALGW